MKVDLHSTFWTGRYGWLHRLAFGLGLLGLMSHIAHNSPSSGRMRRDSLATRPTTRFANPSTLSPHSAYGHLIEAVYSGRREWVRSELERGADPTKGRNGRRD